MPGMLSGAGHNLKVEAPKFLKRAPPLFCGAPPCERAQRGYGREVTFSAAVTERLTTAVRNSISVHLMMTYRSRRDIAETSLIRSCRAVQWLSRQQVLRIWNLQETVVGESVFSLLNDCASERIPAFNSRFSSLYGSFCPLPCPAISQSGQHVPSRSQLVPVPCTGYAVSLVMVAEAYCVRSWRATR